MHFLGGGPIGRMANVAAQYRELFAARTEPPLLGPDTVPMVGKVCHVFVADSDAEAERIARRAWGVYHLNLTKVARDFFGEQQGATAPAGDPSLGGDFDRARTVEAAVFGSPETVRQYVARYAAESGCNYFVGAFQWGDLSSAEASRSLELFAKEVMPGMG
jgi:alkanesulfonate monooxygenase SsuD/methylene tetrahydromethanopterin reductase-like flavin-dependent oxidoreductase (luciferase family)